MCLQTRLMYTILAGILHLHSQPDRIPCIFILIKTITAQIRGIGSKCLQGVSLIGRAWGVLRQGPGIKSRISQCKVLVARTVHPGFTQQG